MAATKFPLCWFFSDFCPAHLFCHCYLVLNRESIIDNEQQSNLEKQDDRIWQAISLSVGAA